MSSKGNFEWLTLHPLSVTLIIQYPYLDNKFFYGVLVKSTVSSIKEE